MAERDLGLRKSPWTNVPTECRPNLGIAQHGVSEHNPYQVDLDNLTIICGGSQADGLKFEFTKAVLTVQGIDFKTSGRQIMLNTPNDLYEAFLAQRIFGPADSLIHNGKQHRGGSSSFFLL